MSKSHLLVVCAVGGLLVWLFAPALAGRESFVFRDAAHFYHPLFELIRAEWGRGRLPLWNPYDNTGMPLAAETTSSVFYPGKLIFALPLDYTLLYNLYVVSHVGLAAAGGFWLARHWGTSVPAAGLAAVSYAFSGNVLFQYANVPFLVGAAWLPCAWLLADRMLLERNWPSAVGLGAVMALLVTGGDPQMAYNAGLIAALYVVLLWRGGAAPSAASASPPASQIPGRRAWRPVTLLAMSAATCALLAAIQILPAWEAARASGRAAYAAPRSVWELAATWTSADPDAREAPWYSGLVDASPRGHQRHIYEFSVGPWRLMEYLWPNVAGRQFPTHRRWASAIPAEGRLWTPSLYMGLFPLLLAASTWSLRRAAPMRTRWASWAVLLSALASLGVYGPVWALRELDVTLGAGNAVHVGDEVGGLYWLATVLLPGYVYFRYPAKLLVVASLGMSLLAARGWDEAWRGRAVGLRRALVCLAIASLLGLAALLVGWPACRGWLAAMPADPLFGPFDADGAWRDVSGALVHTAIVAGVLLVLVWRAAGRFAPAAALLVTVFDLAVAQSWLVPYAPADLWRRRPEVLDVLPADRDSFRINRDALSHPAEWRRASSPDRQRVALSWDRETLSPKYHLPYRLALVEASSTMAPYDYQVLWESAREHGPRVGDVRLPHPSVLDLLAARFSLSPPDAAPAGAAQLLVIDTMAVVPRPAARPRAWIVHDVEVLPTLSARTPPLVERRTEDVLFPAGRPRDWSAVAVVESDEPLPLGLDGGAMRAGESCAIVAADPLRVEVAARLASPGLVVLADAFAPGWELTVESDGVSRAAPILRTNRVQRGVLLPAGRHRLVFRYRPKSVLWGGVTSGLSVVGLLAIAAILIVARRKPAQ